MSRLVQLLRFRKTQKIIGLRAIFDDGTYQDYKYLPVKDRVNFDNLKSIPLVKLTEHKGLSGQLLTEWEYEMGLALRAAAVKTISLDDMVKIIDQKEYKPSNIPQQMKQKPPVAQVTPPIKGITPHANMRPPVPSPNTTQPQASKVKPAYTYDRKYPLPRASFDFNALEALYAAKEPDGLLTLYSQEKKSVARRLTAKSMIDAHLQTISTSQSAEILYQGFSEDQKQLIKDYYYWYAQRLYKEIKGSLRMEVSEQKTKQLINLKGDGHWDFNGIVDTGARGNASCELGHPLRFCFFAINKQTGKQILFGETCYGDFFDLNEETTGAFRKIKQIMITEIQTMREVNLNRLLNAAYTSLMYDNYNIYRALTGAKLNELPESPVMDMLCTFIQLDVPVPMSLIKLFYAELEVALKENIFLGSTTPERAIAWGLTQNLSHMYDNPLITATKRLGRAYSESLFTPKAIKPTKAACTEIFDHIISQWKRNYGYTNFQKMYADRTTHVATHEHVLDYLTTHADMIQSILDGLPSVNSTQLRLDYVVAKLEFKASVLKNYPPYAAQYPALELQGGVISDALGDTMDKFFDLTQMGSNNVMRSRMNTLLKQVRELANAPEGAVLRHKYWILDNLAVVFNGMGDIDQLPTVVEERKTTLKFTYAESVKLANALYTLLSDINKDILDNKMSLEPYTGKNYRDLDNYADTLKSAMYTYVSPLHTIEKETDADASEPYRLKDHPALASVVEAVLTDKEGMSALNEKQASILNSIVKYGKCSDKQYAVLKGAYKKAKGKDLPSDLEKFVAYYVPEESKETVSGTAYSVEEYIYMAQKVIDAPANAAITPFSLSVCKTVVEKEACSEKQAKYVLLAYNQTK